MSSKGLRPPPPPLVSVSLLNSPVATCVAGLCAETQMRRSRPTLLRRQTLVVGSPRPGKATAMAHGRLESRPTDARLSRTLDGILF